MRKIMGRKPKTAGPTARNNPEAFKQVLTRMGVDGWRALRMLAVERDTTINALAIEAFNDLLSLWRIRCWIRLQVVAQVGYIITYRRAESTSFCSTTPSTPRPRPGNDA
jgi:hypothetical protein